MRLNDDEGHENEPMLPTSIRSPVHGSIDIDDGPVRFSNSGSSRPKTATSDATTVRWAKQRFSKIYIILAILILIALAVLIVAIFLVIRVKKIDKDYDEAKTNVGNQFRKLYEQMALLKTGRHGTFTENDLEKISKVLTPEQLNMAKMYGILPKNSNQLSPGIDGLQPIVPVSTFSPQMDDNFIIKNDDKEAINENHWSKKDCDIKCKRTDITTPPLVVISLDGFAREYLDRKIVKTLERLSKCGSKSEFMYPSYPSKTFPNHYTMATGLYPESHGIIDNGVYDPEIYPHFIDFRKMPDKKMAKKFFGGEPIWSSAVKNGKRMYCLFWPGCSYDLGYNPTIDLKYNKSLQYSERINMIINWLEEPIHEKPSMIMAYFDQPDYVGHYHTNDQQVNVELKYIDTVLEHFITKLHQHDLLDCINLIIVSDHGMQYLSKRIYIDKKIDVNGMEIANGVVGRIYLANSAKSEEDVRHKLTCPNDKSYNVFLRDETPKRYHYSKTKRIGDVILDGHPGTMFFKNKSEDYNITSDHGYDYLHPEMHAIFFAHGPNIQSGLTLPPFQNIELFNLFVDLLRLPHETPNNGTIGLLKPLLRDYQPIYQSKSFFLHVVPPCIPVELFKSREINACEVNGKMKDICKDKASMANTILNQCHLPKFPSNFFHIEKQDFCLIDLCSLSVLTTPNEKPGNSLAVFEALTDSEADIILKNDKRLTDDDECFSVDTRFDRCQLINTSRELEGYKSSSIMSNILNELNDIGRIHFPLYPGFIEGPFTYLQNLTHHYAKKYSRIVTVTGTVYDKNFDGLADEELSNITVPTHLYRIILRCNDNRWNLDGKRCDKNEDLRVLAFVLKNEKVENNCLDSIEYLMLNTARVKDIELLTGIHFFEEPLWYTEIESLRLRTNITQELWPL